MNRLVTIMILLGVALASCEKILFKEKGETTSPKVNFDYLWKQCDEKYAFFEVKDIDWRQIQLKYRSRISENMSDDSLFAVMGQMLNELKDDHTNLISSFNISRYSVEAEYQDNYSWRIITENYLPRNYYISGSFKHDFIKNGEIGYIRFDSFNGDARENIEWVLKRYKNTKGLILDLRENGGGATNDIFDILSHFVDKETTLYYSRLKSGQGHNDFGEPIAATVKPFDGYRYPKKVIMLVDRGTYSAGSFTSLATKAIPRIVLIGDTTGGGLGMPNGGQLPNGWRYRFSVTQTLDLNMNPQWENGVPPDIVAYINWNDMSKDEVLERAIQELQ